MAAKTQSHDQLHVFFFPFMAPGHLIPMTDIARIFASHGTKSTIITTPQNVKRFESIIERDDHRQSINILKMDFPCAAANLPPNCENLDSLPSRGLSSNFSKANMMLQPQAHDDLVRRYRPDAIISDFNFPWTVEIARKYNIPRISFNGTCCFSLCLSMAAGHHKPNVKVSSETEPFFVPGLPEPVYTTMSRMPDQFFGNTGLHEMFEKIVEAERDTYRVVANTFYDIEPEYVKHYEKLTGKVMYPVGPVSLFNTKALDMAERGIKASSISEGDCVSWLDSKKRNSVLYVCFGSLCEFPDSQLLEIALGLEASKVNFIWVVKDSDKGKCKFLTNDFEERIKERGLVIKGWAPQVLILNHPAVGGFMTHCGWNSVLESVSASVPMITWPLFAEQFYNENFVVTQLRIGTAIGVERGLAWGEEEKVGVLIERDRVEEVVTRFMITGGSGQKDAEEMRKRVSEVGELARLAVTKGGSSYANVDILITDLLNHKRHKIVDKKFE